VKYELQFRRRGGWAIAAEYDDEEMAIGMAQQVVLDAHEDEMYPGLWAVRIVRIEPDARVIVYQQSVLDLTDAGDAG
jgi:hypothetical protein